MVCPWHAFVFGYYCVHCTVAEPVVTVDLDGKLNRCFFIPNEGWINKLINTSMSTCWNILVSYKLVLGVLLFYEGTYHSHSYYLIYFPQTWLLLNEFNVHKFQSLKCWSLMECCKCWAHASRSCVVLSLWKEFRQLGGINISSIHYGIKNYVSW